MKALNRAIGFNIFLIDNVGEEMDKNNKKRYIFIVAMTFCLIIGAFKVREYYILKDSFVFSKDNVVGA